MQQENLNYQQVFPVPADVPVPVVTVPDKYDDVVVVGQNLSDFVEKAPQLH